MFNRAGSRRRWWSPGWSLAVLSLAASSSALGAERAGAPNVLLIIADDLGWRDVGYHGSEIRTPHLDRLAREGVRLERHYVYPTCSPTRAGLLTGRNPSRFGIHAPIGGRSRDALPKDTPTLSRVLRQRGYTTALCGKWHLGLRPEVGPRQYGFDATYGYFHGQIDQLTHVYKNGDRSWHRNDEFLDEPGHATDLIAAEAVRLVKARRESPFFLWVAFSVPHYPVQEGPRWTAPYAESIADPSRRLYAASVAHMDAAIGRLVAALEEAGRLDDTLIVFTSDNGGQKDHASQTDYGGKHGPYPTLGDNRPLRGWKTELYEGGVRVPAFAYWKGRLAPRVENRTVSLLDWFPTFVRLAGGTIDATWNLEGRDVWPILANEGELPAAQPLYWNTGRQSAVIDGEWKFISTRTKPGADELFHLGEDGGEQRNRAADEPAVLERLRGELARQSDRDR